MNRIRQTIELMHATCKEVSMRRKLVAYWASMIFVLLAAMLILASLFGVFSIRESNLRHALDALVGQKIFQAAVALAPLHRIGDGVCYRLRQSRRVGRIHSGQRLRELIVMASRTQKRRRRFPSGGALSV